MPSHKNSLRLLFGGDVSFDHQVRQCNYLGAWRLREKQENSSAGIQPLKAMSGYAKMRRRIIGKLSRIWQAIKIDRGGDPPFQELLVKTPENIKQMDLDGNYKSTLQFNIDYPSVSSKYYFPFEKIAPFLHQKDLVMVNLETPLTRHTRAYGLFISSPYYAQAMANAGISMVNIANNHVFDAGEIGFFETIDQLSKAGILYTGGGKDFENARLGRSVKLKDMKLVFLGYSQFCNNRFSSVAAEYPGILPLDPQLIIKDIKNARKIADFVFLVLHWGIENVPDTHPRQMKIAHLLIDAGADGIIGHHPHVPHGIEIYKGKPILYSLGNFIFAQGDIRWNHDNYLAEIVLKQKQIQGVNIYPISGQKEELFQPEVLTGGRADSTLYELQKRSSAFDTKIVIQNHVGHIKIH